VFISESISVAYAKVKKQLGLYTERKTKHGKELTSPHRLIEIPASTKDITNLFLPDVLYLVGMVLAPPLWGISGGGQRSLVTGKIVSVKICSF